MDNLEDFRPIKQTREPGRVFGTSVQPEIRMAEALEHIAMRLDSIFRLMYDKS